jgi:hypothetical protein
MVNAPTALSHDGHDDAQGWRLAAGCWRLPTPTLGLATASREQRAASQRFCHRVHRPIVFIVKNS